MAPKSTFWPLALALGATAFSGCTTQQPLISHAHVGHALTTWHDTPGQQGLIDVAAGDLEIAEREASLSCANPLNGGAEPHAANVLHALVPEALLEGPGSGYGALRAVMGTVEHLEYAATSKDASLNLVAAVAQLAAEGVSIHARLEVAAELAQNFLDTPPGNDRRDLCVQLLDELRVAVHGGVIGPRADGPATMGFKALHHALLASLDRERDPAYEPVSRRYVLGLVRLPTGEWRYRLPQRGNQAPIDFGYSYGY